ncbi:MAG: hypothetical protein HY211_00465 [Candidatus Omnitrophica bacterium]|nr:hypothetical protein [Candidatus Omnitrophota bacterium]
MSGQHVALLDLIVKQLNEAGLSDTALDPQGDILVVKLPAAGRARLLADPALRRDLVHQARILGFSRLTLEL